MLILLPPSETKAAPPDGGAPLDLDSLSFPELTPVRARVLDHLVRVSGQRNALRLLGVPPGLAEQVAANTALRSTPCVPVGALYTGVLYDALDLPSLSPVATRRASEQIVVVSALFGALRPSDMVPPYRLAMDAVLPRLGPLAALWRPGLGRALTEAVDGGVVVDCRSSNYAAAWRPSPAVVSRTVAVRVLVERAGRRSVVSHMAKQARGHLARLLVQSRRVPTTPEEVAIAAAAGPYAVELHPPPRAGAGWQLDLIEHQPS